MKAKKKTKKKHKPFAQVIRDANKMLEGKELLSPEEAKKKFEEMLGKAINK